MSRGVTACAIARIGRTTPAARLSKIKSLRFTGMPEPKQSGCQRMSQWRDGAPGQIDSLYSPRMSHLYAGVDLGGTSFIAVVADRKGRVLGSSDCATTPGASAAETIEAIGDHIVAAAKDASIKPGKLRAIGIGAPGAVDPKRGIVVR